MSAPVPAEGTSGGRPERPGSLIPDTSVSLPIVAVIVTLGLLPLLAVTLRVLATLGEGPAGLGTLWDLGNWLNSTLTLLWVPPEDRAGVLYILLLPLAALLTAVTRLSLGLRVLGFRAILIAIGFQEIGILPSLLLIAVIALTIAALRPLMRRAGMPLYARVASILCIVAVTMVVGLLAGAGLDSPTLWSFAFFPVVILAMLAESIADSIAREDAATAAWRTAWTIALALLIATVSQIGVVRELALVCPELIVTQLALILVVSEFFDWRLFETFRPGRSTPAASEVRPVIAIVRDGDRSRLPGPHRASPSERYRQRSLQPLLDTLRDQGHVVRVFDTGPDLSRRLRRFFPGPPDRKPVNGIVMNCAGHTQGVTTSSRVANLCEWAGIAHTGPDARAMATMQDRHRMLDVLREAGVPAPDHASGSAAPDLARRRGFPLRARSRLDPDGTGIKVRDAQELAAVADTLGCDPADVLVETRASGRALHAIVLEAETASETPAVLPIVEWSPDKRRYQAAAGLSPWQVDAIAQVARQTFDALRCRDIARIDVRMATSGALCVTSLHTSEWMFPLGPAALAAAAAGMDFPALAARMARGAAVRRGKRHPRGDTGSRSSVIGNPLGGVLSRIS